MTIDPKEQAFLDNLKEDFKGDDGKISPLERKVLNALERKFNEKNVDGKDVVTGAPEIKKVVDAVLADERGELNEDIKKINDKKKDVKTGTKVAGKTGILGGIGKVIKDGVNDVAEGASDIALKGKKDALQDVMNFHKDHPRIEAMAKAQLPAKTLLAEASSGVDTDKPAAATSTPAPAAGNMSATEATFLNNLKEGYARTNGKAGKLSGIEKGVCDALEEEFNKPGQTGWKEIAGIANDVQAKMIAGVKEGSIKISEVILRNTYPAEDKAITENIKDTKAAELLPASKKKDKALQSLADTKAEKQAKFETKILEQFSWNPIVELAQKSGFPENSVAPTPLQIAITNAAGADKVLDSKELQALLKDPKFLEAAQQVTGEKPTKIGVHNDAAKGKDTLKVGGTEVPLGDTGVELDAAVKDGDVSLPKAAAPAKKSGRVR